MAAGLGFKDFTTGEVLTAADVDGYLMQGVWVFASAAARDAAVTSPQEGNFAYLKDTNVTTYYTGSAWANLDTTGMTNPMTTTGDIIYSSPGSTPVRLGIGSTGNILTVAGGVPSWAAPAGGGSLIKIAGASFSSQAAVEVQSVFTSTYDVYLVTLLVHSSTSTSNLRLQYMENTTAGTSAAYYSAGFGYTRSNSLQGFGTVGGTSHQLSDQLGPDSQPNNSFNIYFDGFGISGVDKASIMGTCQYGGNQSAGQFGGLYGPGTTNTWNGFKISASAGNITGSYVVYGLAK